MSNSLRFITSNPAISGFDARRKRQEETGANRLARDRDTFDLEQKQLQAQKAQARDRALSGVVSTPGQPATPGGTVPSTARRSASALAGIGQGTEAAKLAIGEERRGGDRSDRAFASMAQLLGQDRPDAALIVAKNAGTKITPAMQTAFGNASFRRGFKMAFDRNKTAFKDARQFERQMQRDITQLLGQIAQNQPGEVPQAGGGAPRLTPNRATADAGQAVGAPFQDRAGNLFVRDKAGNPIPLRRGGVQLQGPKRNPPRDPFAVSPTQREGLIQKAFQTLVGDFNDQRTVDEKLAAATAAVDASLQAGGGRNPAFGRADQEFNFPGAGRPDQELPSATGFFDPAREVQPQAGPRVQPQPQQTQPAPADPAQRVPGQVYQTPRGPLRWTGIPGQEWSRR